MTYSSRVCIIDVEGNQKIPENTTSRTVLHCCGPWGGWFGGIDCDDCFSQTNTPSVLCLVHDFFCD